MDDFNFQNPDQGQNQDLNQNPVQYQDQNQYQDQFQNQMQDNNMVNEQYNNQYNGQYNNDQFNNQMNTQMNNQEQPNNMNNNKKFNFNLNKKNTIILGSIGGAVVICIIAIIILLNSINNPKKTFAKVFEVARTEYKSKIEKISKDSLKHEINVKMDTESKDKNGKIIDNSESVFFSIDDVVYNIVLQYDEKNNLQIDYDWKSYNNEETQSMYYNTENKEYYVKIKDFKDKWIKCNSSNYEYAEELVSQIKENPQEKNTELLDIVLNEVLKELSNKSIESGKETITVDGKSINANKSCLKLSNKDIANIVNKVASNLKENEEFKKLFDGNEYADQILDYIIESTDVSKNQDIDDKIQYEIDVYTKGFINQEFVGITFKILEEEGFRIDYRYSKNKHEISAKYVDARSEFSVNCAINIVNENNFNSDVVVESKDSDGESMTMTIHMDYKISPEVNMDTITKNNSLTVDDLTEQDFYDYMKKDQNSNYYSLYMLPFYSEFLEKNNLEYSSSTGKFYRYSKANVFNEEYEAYMGKNVSAANTKALLQKVRTNNTLAERNEDSDSYRTIYIYVNGNYYKPTDIIKEIKSQYRYYINTKEYDDEGYIKSIEIAIATQSDAYEEDEEDDDDYGYRYGIDTGSYNSYSNSLYNYTNN